MSSAVSRGGVIAGFALFALIGATAAMFGPVIPGLRATFHISAAAAGLMLSGHFAGSLIGTLSPSFAPARLRAPRIVAAASTACFSAGCLVIGVAQSFPAAVAGAVVEGAGWGGLVIIFNALFSSGFGARSPAMLTLLNAVYGIGAIAGPAGVGLIAAGGFRGPFITAAVVAILFIPLVMTLPSREVVAEDVDEADRLSGAGRRSFLVAFVAAFFLYGGLEGGIGAWEPTHLVATGLSPAAAATITSLFWSLFTVGRLVAAPLSLVVKQERLVLGCLATVCVLILAARSDIATATAYTMCGLALAPIFPLAVVWSRRVMPASQRVTSFVISGDLLGGVLLSALLGVLVAQAGAVWLPIAFSAMAGGAFGILLGIYVSGQRP